MSHAATQACGPHPPYVWPGAGLPSLGWCSGWCRGPPAWWRSAAATFPPLAGCCCSPHAPSPSLPGPPCRPKQTSRTLATKPFKWVGNIPIHTYHLGVTNKSVLNKTLILPYIELGCFRIQFVVSLADEVMEPCSDPNQPPYNYQSGSDQDDLGLSPRLLDLRL